MKRVRTKRLVIAGLIGCGMLAVCAVGYGYVKSFRMDTPVYASVVSYRDQEGALGKTFCFEYEGAWILRGGSEFRNRSGSLFRHSGFGEAAFLVDARPF